MSENILQEVDSAGESISSGRKTPYVSRTLANILHFVTNIYSKLGPGYHDAAKIAAVNGLKALSIKQQLTTAQQYGLLEIKFGIGYRTTNLFTRIHLYKNDKEKRSATIEALKKPETYAGLFKEFEFHTVPLEGVRNHLIRDHGYTNDLAEKLAQIFIDNLKENNLLDSRGVLMSGVQFISTPEEIIEDPYQKPQVQETPIIPDSSGKDEDTLFELPIPLPGKRRAFLKYPVDTITRKDIKVITKALEFIASSLEDEEEI